MTADAVVVGAGIAGVATAYQLAMRGRQVVLVDPRPPLTLTSDKSTECYRNWWPNRPMVGLMNRSIDLLEAMAVESGNVFGLTRRGYLFVTADPGRLDRMRLEAENTATLGGGRLRSHPGPVEYAPSPAHGFDTDLDGADLFTDGDTLRRWFPYLTGRAVGGLHVRRAGWFGAQQAGAWMLERARDLGARLVADQVEGIELGGGRVSAVRLGSGSRIITGTVVDAAGPMAAAVGAMVGLTLPLHHELHLKVSFRDHLGVIPREAPMIIWSDPQRIAWSPEERAALTEDGREDLLGEMPVFCHGRPEGGADSPYLLSLWEYHRWVGEPAWPLPDDPLYPEVVMRGMTTMIPGLAAYLERLPQSSVDGGYYTKTWENRPLIGPAGPEGFVLVVGLSGFGVMAAAGAGDLVARHVTGESLPGYAPAFLLSRYQDPSYLAGIDEGMASGQL